MKSLFMVKIQNMLQVLYPILLNTSLKTFSPSTQAHLSVHLMYTL